MNEDEKVYELTPKGLFLVSETEYESADKRWIEHWYAELNQYRDQATAMNDIITIFVARFKEIADLAEETHDDPAIALLAREALDWVMKEEDGETA